MGKTLYDKIWDAHLVHQAEGDATLLYIDRHMVHEVTSPQAFEALRVSGRKVRRPDLTLAVADHNVPTKDRDKPIADPESRDQIAALEWVRENIAVFGDDSFDSVQALATNLFIRRESGWFLVHHHASPTTAIVPDQTSDVIQ